MFNKSFICAALCSLATLAHAQQFVRFPGVEDISKSPSGSLEFSAFYSVLLVVVPPILLGVGIMDTLGASVEHIEHSPHNARVTLNHAGPEPQQTVVQIPQKMLDEANVTVGTEVQLTRVEGGIQLAAHGKPFAVALDSEGVARLRREQITQ